MGLLYSPFSFRERKGLWIYYYITLGFVAGMLIMIYRFSAADSLNSSRLSMGISMRILEKLQTILSGLLPGQNLDQFAQYLEHPLRKLAHFSEYALLNIFIQMHIIAVWRLEIFRWKDRISRKSFRMAGWGFCVLYAISDEIHQYFVPGRACRFSDVCIDGAGAFFGLLVFLIILRRLLDGMWGKVYNEENLNR